MRIPIRLPATFCLLALLAGCDVLAPDLEEKPITFLVGEQFFRNADDALAATRAVYGPLRRGGYYQRDFVVLTELQADYLNGRGSYLPAGNFRHDNLNIQRIAGVWNDIYSSINRANLVIDRIPGISMDERLKTQYVAEARFLRGMGYYHLVRLWGPVPLRVEPVTSLDALAAPRAAVDDVYRVIVEDLQFAEANLPDRFDLADVGRATRWAAKTLLADVYLTREQYAQAAAKAKEVMDSGRFSLVEVREPDDFLKIFGPEVIESSEEILSVKFSSAGGGNTDLVAYTHNPGAGYTPVGFRTLLGEPRSQVLATWHEQDLRRLYKLYSADPNDSRFLTASEPELFKKYRDPTGSGNTDIPVFRYPEVLLIFAEAEAAASGGPTPAAYEALNRVRRRAFGHDSLVPSPADLAGLGAAEFRDAVLMERAWEFVLEAKRWFDLVRTKRALSTIQPLGEPITEKNLLWPVPTQELDNNPALSQADQNPGW
jgi:starch-binding outer membrane protein, SusD/RagB family